MKKAPGERAPQTRGHTIRWAFLYDVLVGVLFLGRERAVRELTLDLAGLQPGDSVLDVGCGTGSLAVATRQRMGPAAAVHGIDAAPEMIARARRKAAEAGVDVDFRTAAAERLPYPDGRFDAVLSSLMLHHLPVDLRRPALAEMRRVLKPGGRLPVVDFAPPEHPVTRALTTVLLGHTMAHNNLSDNLPLVRAVGFVHVEHGPTPHPLLSFLSGRAGEPRT